MNSLSEIQVKEISSRYVRGYDKWYRMCAGISSDLERYEENIIYLKIRNTGKAHPSSYKTALHFAENWMHCNEELREAKGFVVAFYSSGPTGFMVSAADLSANEHLADDIARRLKASSHDENRLINIFSGLLPPQE